MIWQYNGVAPWFEIAQWCADNLEHTKCTWETVYFYDEREYLLFLLRWG